MVKGLFIFSTAQSSIFWVNKVEHPCIKRPHLLSNRFSKMSKFFSNLVVIYQTRGRVFYQISKHGEVGWKMRRSRVFLTDFKVFEYLMEHSFKCSIQLLKLIIKCGENEGKNCQNLRGLKPGIQTSFMVVISFVFSSWIINEFKKL